MKKTPEQKKHVFQVHTMDTDNIAKVSQGTENKTAPPPKGIKLPQINKKQAISQKHIPQSKNSKQTRQQTDNPFLTEDAARGVSAKKGLFAPETQKDPVEKINQTPADIAPQDKTPQKKSGNTQKKMIHIIMIIFIVLFLIGITGFGVYMLKLNKQQPIDNQNVLTDIVDIPTEVDVDNVDDSADKIIDDIKTDDAVETIEQIYATELPNYFSIDVESTTTQQDIATELKTIAQNMQKQDITGPISFIVTDQNSNPVSFHVFSTSAGMNIPQDIATSLEEGFEIYAYNDDANGVRFGFGIDAKNVETLRTAITTSEARLPRAFDIILNKLGVNATSVVFNDNSYKTHPIRYYNLNETESYSIDYTINDNKWIVGTTKNTLRAIIDHVKKVQIPSTDEML